MNKYPPRPKATREIIMQAAAKVADAICDSSTAAQDIADAYERRGPGGFDIARELDINGWDITASDVEELDGMQFEIDRAVRELEEAWVKENDIQPPLAIGIEIEEGVITGVCEHWSARYLVKERGCTREGRSLLIKFENAKAAGDQKAMAAMQEIGA